MAADSTKTFTAASAATSDHLVIPDQKPSIAAGGDQAVRVFAWTTDSTSGTPTIELALVDRNTGEAIARLPGTVTTTTRRGGADGASGVYLCDVSWTETGTATIDLLGSDRVYGWRLGVTNIDGLDDLTVRVVPSPII